MNKILMVIFLSVLIIVNGFVHIVTFFIAVYFPWWTARRESLLLHEISFRLKVFEVCI